MNGAAPDRWRKEKTVSFYPRKRRKPLAFLREFVQYPAMTTLPQNIATPFQTSDETAVLETVVRWACIPVVLLRDAVWDVVSPLCHAWAMTSRPRWKRRSKRRGEITWRR